MSTTSSLPSATETKSAPTHQLLLEASEWFALLRSGTASPEDRVAWQEWLDQDARHAQAWSFVDTVSQRFNAVQTQDHAQAAVNTLQNAQQSALSRRKMLKGLAIFAGVGALGWTVSKNEALPDMMASWSADIHTARGEVRELSLQDGSLLWLNTASSVNADYQPLLRRLHLIRGEIFIQTATDHRRPFVVDSRHGRMRALGTRFNVYQKDDATYLSVFEGAVEVTPRLTGESIVVHAGKQMHFSSMQISDVTAADNARDSWRQGVLIAKDMPLSAVLKEIERYHYGFIKVSPEVADLKVVGGYPLNNREQAFQMLANVLPIHIKRTTRWLTTVETIKK